MTTRARALRTTIAQRHTEQGATLVEVMIAGAIGLIVILGVNGAINRANLNVKAIEQKNELRELEELIKLAGSTEAQCQAIFAGSGVDLSADTFNVNGTDTTTQALTRIVIPNKGNQVIQPTDANLQYIVPGLRTTALTLERPGTTLGGTSYQGWLQIVAEREEGRTVNKTIGVRLFARVPINLIDSNSNGNANSCLVGASNGEQIKTELVVAPVGPADCVGSTHAAIQECLDLAAASNPARGVLVKAGNYTVSTAIAMPANTTLRGEPGAVLVGSGGVDILTVGVAADSDYTEIKGLTFNQNAQTGATSAIKVGNTAGRILKNIFIEKNHFINTTGVTTTYGISLLSLSMNMYRVRIRDNTFGGFQGLAGDVYRAFSAISGRAITGALVDVVIEHNRIEQNVPSGITSGTVFLDIQDTGYVQDITINNNTLKSTVGPAVRVYAAPATTGVSSNIVVTNNVIAGNSVNPPIFISGPTTTELNTFDISNNIVESNSTAGGISLSGFNATATCTSNNTIRGNQVNTVGTGVYGITVTACTRTIANNRITNYQHGIYYSETSGLAYKPKITGNTINTTRTGIQTTAGSYIAENDIQGTYLGILTTTIGNHEIYNNLIDSTNAGATTASVQCGGVAVIGGMCVYATNSAIKGNRIRINSALAAARGIFCSTGLNDSSYVSNNTFVTTTVPVDTSCYNYMNRSQDTNGTVTHNAANINMVNTGDINLSGAGSNINLTGGGDINLTHATSNVNLTGGGDVNVTNGDVRVTGTGGINVGTGATTADKISVNGGIVPSGCRPRTGSTGPRLVAAGTNVTNLVVLCPGVNEKAYSCGCVAANNSLVLTACTTVAADDTCQISVRNITGADVNVSSTLRATCCTE